MKSLQFLFKTALFVLALLLPSVALAYDFEVDGIYYNIIGNEASVTYQGDDYYYDNNYSGEIVIPETVTYDGVTYPVTAIGDYAFSYCCVTNIEIPNSIKEIGEGSFERNNLVSIEIPKSVSDFGYHAFRGCKELTSITVASDNPYFDSRDNCNAIISTEGNGLLVGCQNTVIPDGVTWIAPWAFCGCENLYEIEIPNSVTGIDYYAFAGCKNLEYIFIPNSVTDIYDGAFSYCSSLGYVEIPNSVTHIGKEAFIDCTRLFFVSIGNSVTEIADYTFAYCEKLRTINIPKSVTSIGNSAFSYCKGLSDINIPNSVTLIGNDAFEYCESLTSIVIPNSVTQIGEDAFMRCESLTNVTIGNSVTSLGRYVFGCCYELDTVKCLAINPPSIYHDTFDYDDLIFENASLEVPPVAIEVYQNHEYWGKFFSIQPIIVPGDMDGNGLIGISDVAGLIDLVLAGDTPVSVADLNGDGQVSVADIAELIDQLFADGGN